MKALFFYLNKYRHPTAIILCIMGTYIIHQVTLFLYFPIGTDLTLIQTAKALWFSDDLYLQFIAMINFAVKPCMIYGLYIFLFQLLRSSKRF
jgi:hypothetical protein